MTDACITIDSSDEDDVQIMDPPVVQVKPESSEEVKRKVPLHTVETGKSIFTALLSTCKNADPSSEMDIIVNKMWKRFHQADSSYTSSAKFIDFVKTLITKAPKEPFCQLKSVSDDLKFHKTIATNSTVESVAQPGASTSTNADETDRKTLRTIRKLEKLVSKLQRKIDCLEEQEVDLDDSSDEQNSAYIQVCRYKTRICDVYKKICELRKTDTLKDYLLRNIKFSGTKIPAVNRAIERFYNEKREFPDFRQVLTIVEKANDLKNLRLLPFQCHETAVQAFKELGETLKRQRQADDVYTLEYFLGSSDCDPASVNQLLEEKLQENKKLYGNRIDEIIDKYAKKQIEEKLEPEDVPDDGASETAVEDEDEEDEDEDEEDFSSIAEVESNADNSSADEDVEEGNDTDEDADPEEPFEARDFNIVIPDLCQMPEWEAYQKAVHARNSAGTVCQPVPGCSKDVIDDFCEPCAIKTPGSSATKRNHAVVLDSGEDDDGMESRAKVAKGDGPLISVDLTNDSQSTEPASRVAKSLAMSFSVDEDPLANVNASCSQVLNGIADEATKSLASGCESSKSQPFVVVDVESILAKKPAKSLKCVRNKGQNGAKIVETPLSPKTESVVTCKDVDCDGVSISDPGLKDHLKTLSKNGIKIVNVLSKKDSSNTSPVDEKSKGSTNHTENGSEDKTKNGSNVKKNCEIVDIEEVTRQEKTISNTAAQLIKIFSAEPKNSTNLFKRAVPSNTNQSSKPALFRFSSQQETKKTQDNRPPWQKFSPSSIRFPATSTPKPSNAHQPRPSSVSEPVNQETRKTESNHPPWQKFSPSCNRFPATSTPKPSTAHQPRPSSSGFQMPSSNRPNFGPRSYPGSQRRPMSQPQFGGSFGPHPNMRGGPMPPRHRNVYMGPGPAMTKRTVQTTQKFVKGNNIYTQTMTVVQEVQMQSGNAGTTRSPFASNGPIGRGGSSNSRFGGATGCGGATQSSSSSSNHSGGVPQNPAQKIKRRKNSADVITLE